MLARLQQFTTLTLLFGALAWVVGAWGQGRPLLALAGAALLLCGHALVLGAEFLMLAAVHRDDPAPRARARQLLKAWWSESLTAPKVFCWRQPFRSQAEPDFLPAASGRTGVLLVHGFVCNRGFWNPWLRRLRAEQRPFCAVDLEPVFGSIDDSLHLLDAAIGRLVEATGRPPVIVAHSMGGLVVRAWLAQPGRAAQVRRVITIGTPHRGTWLARFAHSRNGFEMKVGGRWLAALCAREAALADALPPSRWTCFYSHCDNIVFPASTATLPGADNRHVECAAHVAMAFDPRVVEPAFALFDAPC